MKFCKSCGKQLKDTATFCTECGHKVHTGINPSSRDGVSSIGQRIEQTSTPVKMTKRNKLFLLIGVILVILLVGLYKTGDILTDKERMINKLETALTNENAEEIADLLSTKNKNLDITKDNLDGLLDYLKENPDVEGKIIESLRNQSEAFNEEPESDFDRSDSLLYLNKSGKKFFLYDKYSININPVYMVVNTNYKDTSILMNGQEIGKTKTVDAQETYGPFLPGTYTIEAKLATDFVDLKETTKFTMIDTTNRNNLDLYLNGEDVEIYLSNSSELPVTSNLFIDGKDTKVDVIKNPVFGPVTTEGSMKMKVEVAYPWGTVGTKEELINSNFIEMNNSPFTEEQLSNILKLINQFNQEELEYQSTNNQDTLTTVTSDYFERLREEYDSYENSGYFKGKYLGMILYEDSIKLNYQEATWKLDITTTNNYEGKTTIDGKVEKFPSDRYFELHYDEKNNSWLISKVGYEDSSLYLDGEVKEIENEKTKEIEIGKENEQARVKDEMDPVVIALMDNYLYNLIDAINYNNFETVSTYLKDGSNLYNSQENLVSHLNDQNITEELEDYEVLEWKNEGSKYTIKTKEKIKINYNDGKSETKNYTWTYTAELDEFEDELVLTDIK